MKFSLTNVVLIFVLVSNVVGFYSTLKILSKLDIVQNQFKTAQKEDADTIQDLTKDNNELKFRINQFERQAGESAHLQAYFSKRNSPLADHALALYRYARYYGVDPVLIGAIATVESGGCRSYIVATYNCFGWGSGYISFRSHDQGIETVAKALGTSRTYRRYQETRSIEVFAKIYNPANWQEYAQKIRTTIHAINTTAL